MGNLILHVFINFLVLLHIGIVTTMGCRLDDKPDE